MAHESGHKYGHMGWVGVAGALAGAVLMVYVPSLKAVSGTLVLFAGFHLAGALVLLPSLYLMRGNKVLSTRRGMANYDFGWAPAWTRGPWIAAKASISFAVAVEVAAHAYWPAALLLTLLAAALFAGGLVTRSAARYDHAVLPMVDLLPKDCDDAFILDAGCGAGRTTIALGRCMKKARVVALDRFDSDYIAGGGRQLLERNLSRAGMSARMRIESGDIAALPFDAGSFDAVVSAHVVDHLGPARETALREVYRVLKPGGRFLLVVWVPGWTMFAVANALSFFLTPKREWRRLAARADFSVIDEGVFNGAWFALLEKPVTS